MNAKVRRILTSTGPSRRLYFAVRQAYNIRRMARAAARCFINAEELTPALRGRGGPGLLDLRTADGLTITIRQNPGDAMTVTEVFSENAYARDLDLPPEPVVIDIGGFVGDFSLYAVKRLGARRVIVCEPSPKNWTLLLKNIEGNGYGGRIEPVNKAVTAGGDVLMNVDAPDNEQCMVSTRAGSGRPAVLVPGTSLADLMRQHQIERVDLLKIDCEGGEFEILESTPPAVFSRVANIVFEYHSPDAGDWASLERAKRRLQKEGYALKTRGGLVSARRP